MNKLNYRAGLVQVYNDLTKLVNTITNEKHLGI